MKKSDWGIEITKTSNGFLIKDNNGTITVVEEKDDDELSAAEKLLWEVINFFNLEGSRYDRERILVVRQMGDKYTPQRSEGEKAVKEGYLKIVKKKKR